MSTRLIRFSMIALLAGAPAFAGAQGRFEGIINAKLPNNQGMAEIEYLVKGDQVRMNVQSMGRSMFMLHDASANVMVLPEQRMYMEMPQMSGDMSNMPGARANAGKPADIKWTGKKETIAGYECEHLIASGDDGQYDICAAKNLGSFVAMSNPMGGRRGGGGAQGSWQRLAGEIFPLRVQKVGETAPLFEVTKVEKKSLDDSMFKVPDGFTKMDMGGMGRMGRPPR